MSAPSVKTLLVLLPLWLLGGMNAQAATAVMVLSDDSAAYQETAEAIEHEIGGAHRVVRVLADKLAGASTDLSDAKLIFTVGVIAAEQMSGYAGKTPVLAVLVPKDWYQKSGRARLAEGGRNAGAVVLDQPYSRQLKLIKFALPSASKVGILVSQPNAGIINELEQAARQSHLSIVSAIVDSEAALIESLERILSEADVLLAVPDAVVLNRNTVQSLFITSYRYRDPVAGYSKPLSRAGALVSLYSTPAQIGRQAGEVAGKFFASGRLPGLQWPKYFSVSINSHVARSLDIAVPSEQDLLRELQEGSGND